MGPTVVFTIAMGAKAIETAKLLRSTFKIHHPDIPFFLVDDGFWPTFARQKEIAHNGEIMGMRILMGLFFSLFFKRVVYLDADVLVLGPLPRLIECEEPVVVTNDRKHFDYGMDAPVINAGILAATTPDFWRNWMMLNYSFVLPIIGNFFDQYSLRLLCHHKLVPYTLLPEEQEREFYNIRYFDYEGEWRSEGADVFKGDARVRLWHWAGYVKKTSFEELPPAVRAGLKNSLALVHGSVDWNADNRIMEALLRKKIADYHVMVEEEFRKYSTHVLDGAGFGHYKPPEDLYCSDAPAAWDAFRPPMEGIYRRLLPKAPRYVYSRDPARLEAPDVERYNVPRS